MSKTKKKKKGQGKKQSSIVMTPELIRNMRYEQGGLAVAQELRSFDIDDIIIETYINTQNEKAKKLASMYEKMLMDAKTDEKEYRKKRADMIGHIGEYIVKHQLYREWIDLLTIALENIDTDKILNAYIDEMMDTWRELCNLTPGKLLCGISSQGELLYVNDVYGDWDIPALKLQVMIERKMISQEEFDILFRKNAPVIDRMAQNENMWCIELFDMLPFINERTYKIIPPSPPENYATPQWSLPARWRGTQIYKEAISKRKFMIGKKGVQLKFTQAGDVDSLFIMEDIDRNNELVMLYRLTVHNYGSFTGYYRVKSQMFFSPFSRTYHPTLPKDVENFVLGVYADVVSELNKERKPSYRIEEVESIEEIPSPLPTRVYYQYMASERHGSSGERMSTDTSRSQKPHFRSFALRKLRENQEASEEAKQRATEYGIKLQDGYTFVRAYSVGKKSIHD